MNYILKLSRKISGDRNSVTSKLFLFFNSLLGIIVGYLLWLFLGLFIEKSVLWLVCAVGYVVVFYSILGGILYLMNKDLW